jgi:dipeptidase
MFYKRLFAAIMLMFFLTSPVASWACTSIIVGKNASSTGRILFARTEDWNYRRPVNFLVFPAGHYKGGVEYQLSANGFKYTFSHDSYRYFATPMSYAATLATDGESTYYPMFDDHGVNEKGLAVSATNTIGFKTNEFDPASENATPWNEDTMAKVLLAQCATVEEALKVADEIVTKYGTNSELIQIADKDQAWVFEPIGIHHWVATRVPEDGFAVISNAMVTDRVDIADTKNYRASSDYEAYVKKFEDAGLTVYHEGERTLKNLNVALTFGTSLPKDSPWSTRNVNGSYNSYRRWRGYSTFAPSLSLKPLTNDDNEVYQLYIKPDKPISPTDIMFLQRDRYQNVPAGIGVTDISKTPQPVNEKEEEIAEDGTETNGPRPIGIFRQVENHVYEMNDYPAEIGARMWLSMSAAESSVNLPFYGNITETHPYYSNLVLMTEYQPETAYWLFADLGKKARTNRVMYAQPVKDYWVSYERKLYEEQAAVEAELLSLYAADPQAAAKYATDYTLATSDKAFKKAEQIRDALIAHIAQHPGELFVVPTEEPKDTSDNGKNDGGGGGGGCDAGFGVLVVIFALGSAVLLRKKKI